MGLPLKKKDGNSPQQHSHKERSERREKKKVRADLRGKKIKFMVNIMCIHNIV